MAWSEIHRALKAGALVHEHHTVNFSVWSYRKLKGRYWYKVQYSKLNPDWERMQLRDIKEWYHDDDGLWTIDYSQIVNNDIQKLFEE